MNGKNVSLTEARFKNKVVIVQILGSWCPNCMDETAYMVNYYKKYHHKGVEVVGLAYERTNDYAKSKTSLTYLKNRFNIPYPILITGYKPSGGDPEKSLIYKQVAVRKMPPGKPLSADRWSSVTIPTLVIDGGASPPSIRNAVGQLVDVLPNAHRLTMEGQTHEVDPTLLAPVLTEFFTS